MFQGMQEVTEPVDDLCQKGLVFDRDDTGNVTWQCAGCGKEHFFEEVQGALKDVYEDLGQAPRSRRALLRTVQRLNAAVDEDEAMDAARRGRLTRLAKRLERLARSTLFWTVVGSVSSALAVVVALTPSLQGAEVQHETLTRVMCPVINIQISRQEHTGFGFEP